MGSFLSDSTRRRTSLFLGTVFLLGYFVSVIGTLSNGRLKLLDILLHPYTLSILAIAVLLFAGYFANLLAWIQPIVFFALTPINLSEDNASFYSLAFFVIGVLLLFRFGFFETHRRLKIFSCIAYLFACEIFGWAQSRRPFSQAVSPVFLTIVFLLFLYTVFNDKVVVYLKEPKVKLSLDAKGLSEAEQLYIRALVKGRSVKEVSFEFGISESTVRNTLARAYKKLAISNKSGLAGLAEKYEIVK